MVSRPWSRFQSFESWLQITVSRPNTCLAMARTRLSTSPKGGRQYMGMRPSFKSAMICIDQPSSPTTCSFVRVVATCQHGGILVVTHCTGVTRCAQQCVHRPVQSSCIGPG